MSRNSHWTDQMISFMDTDFNLLRDIYSLPAHQSTFAHILDCIKRSNAKYSEKVVLFTYFDKMRDAIERIKAKISVATDFRSELPTLNDVIDSVLQARTDVDVLVRRAADSILDNDILIRLFARGLDDAQAISSSVVPMKEILSSIVEENEGQRITLESNQKEIREVRGIVETQADRLNEQTMLITHLNQTIANYTIAITNASKVYGERQKSIHIDLESLRNEFKNICAILKDNGGDSYIALISNLKDMTDKNPEEGIFALYAKTLLKLCLKLESPDKIKFEEGARQLNEQIKNDFESELKATALLINQVKFAPISIPNEQKASLYSSFYDLFESGRFFPKFSDKHLKKFKEYHRTNKSRLFSTNNHAGPSVDGTEDQHSIHNTSIMN